MKIALDVEAVKEKLEQDKYQTLNREDLATSLAETRTSGKTPDRYDFHQRYASGQLKLCNDIS